MHSESLKKIHLVFKTHLDIGYTDYACNVQSLYISSFLPRAIKLAEDLNTAGKEKRFVWTTGSWLIHTYLENAKPEERKRMEEAIEAGDIAWHALPFTTHSEFLDASLFRFGLTLSRELDNQFGKKTIAGKMTDVPCHTIAIVPLLAEAGIEFLHLSSNPCSMPPDVPPVFIWREKRSKLTVMYHKGGYSGLIQIPGMSSALCIKFTNDNLGPPELADIQAIYTKLHKRFPGVKIEASTLNNFAEDLRRESPELPIVSQELGDTWIHGIATDPTKVRRYRELCRIRKLWESDGTAKTYPREFQSFSRSLLMIPEHTWGMDTRRYLADYENYSRNKFRKARLRGKFKIIEKSWQEQRKYLENAIKALGPTPLAKYAKKQLAQTEPRFPSMKDFSPLPPKEQLETEFFKIGFNSENGSIIKLQDKRTGRNWAGPQNPFGKYSYEIFSDQDYRRFLKQYCFRKQPLEWFANDFGKPGIEVERHKTWWAKLEHVFHREDKKEEHILLELTAPSESHKNFGNPERLFFHYHLPKDTPTILVDFQWFRKNPCRLPEAMWLSFCPRIKEPKGWQFEKMGELISPLDVIRNGNRKLHAVGQGIHYTDKEGSLTIKTLDAPLVAPGKPSLLNFNNYQPAIKRGMHFNLYNNVWGTNFPMWFGEDARFRFVLEFIDTCP